MKAPAQSAFEAYVNAIFDRFRDLGDSLDTSGVRLHIHLWSDRDMPRKYELVCGLYNNETSVKGTDLEAMVGEMIHRRGFDIGQFSKALPAPDDDMPV